MVAPSQGQRPDRTAFVRVAGLSFAYRTPRGEFPVLNNVTLEAAAGEFICLLGPSGCGKSTLLRLLAGLEQPADPSAMAFAAPQPRVGMIFQQRSVFPWMSVLDNVAYGIDPSVPAAERDARARTWIERMGLAAFERARGYQLSGGMAQRVAIARALAAEAELLLLDEPFAAVDEPTKMLLQRDLARVWESTRPTVFFVTHSIAEALLLADRVVVMTACPTGVKACIEPPFPRPRDAFALQESPLYGETAHRVWELLREEVEAQRGPS